MAVGFDIHLDQTRAAQPKRAADASGVTATAFAPKALDKAIDDDWTDDRRRLEEYERFGDTDDRGGHGGASERDGGEAHSRRER